MNPCLASPSPTSPRSHFPRTRSTRSLSCSQKHRTRRPARCKLILLTRRCISNREQLGSYHYVSGIDTSSSASLAAYINSLTYSIEEPQAWFTKGPTWKVKNGCFWCVRLGPISDNLLTIYSLPIELDDPFPTTRSCFNAFSRVDVRVDVKIPGGVNAYVIDLRGERSVIIFCLPFSTP